MDAADKNVAAALKVDLAKRSKKQKQLVAEATYLAWSADGLLRHTVFVGLREDKPAREVRRETPARPG